ncbi:MAG: hypothetical protein E5V60_32470, partial [Mesorhizobium sp.]
MTDADDDILFDGLPGGQLDGLGHRAGADLHRHLLLARGHGGPGVAIMGGAAARIGEIDAGLAADLGALAGVRMDDQRAGIQREQRLVDLDGLDLELLLDLG